MSTPESQQPKPGWEWYQPTTISGLKGRERMSYELDNTLYANLPVCFNMSNILAWKTGSTASTLTP